MLKKKAREKKEKEDEPDGEEFNGLSDGESNDGGNEWEIAKH